MDLGKLTDEQKWAELGRQYELLNQCQANINLLRQSLSQKQKPEE